MSATGERVRTAALAAFAGTIACAFLAAIDVVPRVTPILAWLLLAASGFLVAVNVAFFQRALLAFLARRFLLMIVSFFGITVLTFTIIRLAPGDPVTIQQGTGGEGVDASKLSRDPGRAIRKRLHMMHEHPFTARGRDPDGDAIQFVFSWGDGPEQGVSEKPLPSGTTETLLHDYSYEGDYEVRVRVRDARGFDSEPSDPVVIRIRDRNRPPERPERPAGPSRAKIGDEVVFTTQAVSGDSNPVSLLIDWGDGALSPPTDPTPSGQEISRKYTYMKSGLFEVRALAVGHKGSMSPRSEPATVLVEDPERPFPRPGRPDGPACVHESEELEYAGRTSATAEVEIDWADGKKTTVAPGPDGRYRAKHRFEREGRCPVRARHVGPGGESAWSNELIVEMSRTNRRPDRPEPPKGPAEGSIRTTVVYQYVRWLADMVRLDFGRSVADNKDVWVMLKERLPRTLFLDLIAFTLIYAIAVPIGIFSSTHRGTKRDRALTVSLFVMYSLPTFWVATMMIWLMTGFKGLPIGNVSCDEPHRHYVHLGSHIFLSVVIGIASLAAFLKWDRTRAHPFLWSLAVFVPLLLLGFLFRMPWHGLLPAHVQDRFWHATLPVMVLTYPGLAALSRYARSGMLEVVRQDYIRTARAKGLSEDAVILKHALRNGMIPILTLMATILPAMISGSIVVEWIFNVQGMGLMALEAVTRRDYDVIMGVTTCSAVLTLIGLLISDILYVLVDPRISFESKTNE